MVESQDSMYSMGSDQLELDQFDTGELNLLNTPSQESTCSNERILDFDSETLINNLYNDCGLQQYYQHDPAQVPKSEHLRQLPILEDFENEWKFDMQLSSETGNKSSWLYSVQLNKVFVKIHTPLNVYPAFTRPLAFGQDEVFIRAMIVYSSQNDSPEPVKKCPNHKEQYSAVAYSDHILRCDNSGAIYHGIENGKVFEEKLSVRVPMREVASNEPLKLTFTCQNSCSGGMNRKSTSLIFTLEDQYFNILGRKCMHFKVCSCPRRDKEKDEQSTKALPKKRKNDGSNAPSTSKKVHLLQKQDSTDTSLMMEQSVMDMPVSGNIVTIKQEQDAQCELKIILPNDQIKKEALRAVYNVIAGEMSRNGHLAYNCYLADIQKQIGK